MKMLWQFWPKFGYDCSNCIDGVFRLKGWNHVRHIIVKFILQQQNSDFFAKYLKFKNLNDDLLEFNISWRIYVNDGLTKVCRIIKHEANKLVSKILIHKITPSRGNVYITLNSGSESILVYSMEKLSYLVTTRLSITNYIVEHSEKV